MIRMMLLDDEEHALSMLEVLLNNIEDIEIVGKYTNPIRALDELKHLSVDAVLLDIDMPRMNGMEVAKEIKMTDPSIQIIFTTAYTEYAIAAFETWALDYLLKPIKIERLKKSMARIVDVKRSNRSKISFSGSITCMGDFSIHVKRHNQPLIWRTSKEKELCAFLVHHAGQVVRQTVILDALWPESNMDKARTYLHTCVSLLRKDLSKAGLEATVSKVGDGYTLHMGGLACDVIELDELLEQILKGTDLSVEKMERISALYTANYMKYCGYHWSFETGEQLASKYLKAMRKMYTFFCDNSQTVQAIECLHKILSISPESELDGRELVKMYIVTGNRFEAIKVYQQLKMAVLERLDLELEEETVSLYRQIIGHA